MIDHFFISNILNTSPSVELLKSRNREGIIIFLVETFYNQQNAISEENACDKLVDYLEKGKILNEEDETEKSALDNYEIKAKRYIQKWTNRGFLTNYQDERGEIFYEISSHSSKTIDWIISLKKEEYVGADSKFKNIFNQLKELVEFSNENKEKRIQLLKDQKTKIDEEIKRLKAGGNIKKFQEFEIVPRFKELNKSARELLSDFKEVEDNFKNITKEIYQKHAEGTLSKSNILEFTFEALDNLKESQQGKSFYAFWSFLLSPQLQKEWEKLTKELYLTLESKNITTKDSFLKNMQKSLHNVGQKVYKANDKMAEKLTRIIGENQANKIEATKNVIQEIKKILMEIDKKGKKPDNTISFTLETDIDINLPFERKLTRDPNTEPTYESNPELADASLESANHLDKLFSQSNIDKNMLRGRIKAVLNEKSQATLHQIIELNNGIEKGLPELFGYLGIVKEFKHTINEEKQQRIIFNIEQNKSITIPEIIITK